MDLQAERRKGTDKEERENFEAHKRAQREPYDPAKEKVVGAAGKIDLDRYGNRALFVEYVSYDGGPPRVQITKRGKNREGTEFSTNNIGALQAEQARQLAGLLVAAANEVGKQRAPQA